MEPLDSPTLSILMPVFNEKDRVQQALEELLRSAIPCSYEIIVVDDGSTDGTTEILQNIVRSPSTIHLLTHPTNQGKGAALRDAITKARGKFCLIQDADLEYNPSDIPLLLEPLLQDGADIVYGSRFWGWKKRRVLFFWHAVGNRVLTFFVNMLADLNLTDVETGYKAFRTSLLRGLNLRSNRFEFEVEATIKAARRGSIFYEVPISYHGRTYAEGKKITCWDGIKALFTSVYFRFF